MCRRQQMLQSAGKSGIRQREVELNVRSDAQVSTPFVIKGPYLVPFDEVLLLQVRYDAPELLRVERVQLLDPEEPCTGTLTSAP